MRWYWQSESRYYFVYLTEDLWGNWLLIRAWGGRFNARGQTKSMLIDSYDVGIELVKKIAKIRHKRGYVEEKKNGE
jgi:predicted DNA-binding WGR domain protein